MKEFDQHEKVGVETINGKKQVRVPDDIIDRMGVDKDSDLHNLVEFFEVEISGSTYYVIDKHDA